MSLDNVTLRAATLDDLTGIAAIYNQLWCNTLRNRGDVEAADFCARFNIAMQLQRSPIALVAEAEGRTIAACCIGIFEDGKPRTNPTWEPCYDEMLAQATEMAKTADAKLEGSLFGDSREKATADRFAATGNEYAQGQLNLIIIVPEWQGKGLGRTLIDLSRAELAKAGCTKFFLMSDCNSDWQFYEHLNMKRILEDHSQDTGDGFIVYMYGGDTQDYPVCRLTGFLQDSQQSAKRANRVRSPRQ